MLSRLVLAVYLAGSLAAATVITPLSLLHVRVRMRDGAHLCTNIFRPAGVTRGPVVLVRTPYGKVNALAGTYEYLVNHGYTFVVQDVRGRYHSGGLFDPAMQETADGEDTLDWIGKQPWCDGNVGMMGGSYLGIAQWRAALGHSPYLKAIFPVVAGSDEYLDRFYSPGGGFKLGHRLQWIAENMRRPNFAEPPFVTFVSHVPLRSADRAAAGRTIGFYQRAMDHPFYDGYWKESSTLRNLNRVKTPAFIVGGWYDNFVESDLAAFQKLQPRFPDNRVLIGPWPHNMSIRFPGVDFGPDSTMPIRTLQAEWFDHWLRHKKPVYEDDPPVLVFVMGENRWRGFSQWPPEENIETPFYLDSGGKANSLSGDGKLRRSPATRAEKDEFTYDPKHPVPTRGGAVCCNPKKFPWGPMDQQEVERRKDVLVYTSGPLQEDLSIVGPVRLLVYVSTSAPDTDIMAKLVDVFPDGMARNLTDGMLRLRYRKSLEQPELVKPGQVYPVTVPVGVTANCFRAGHRIRLEVSSSNFPRFDRNPNTGRAIANETECRKAVQTVMHGTRHPSHLVLPVVPRAGLAAKAKLTSPPAARYLKERTGAVAKW